MQQVLGDYFDEDVQDDRSLACSVMAENIMGYLVSAAFAFFVTVLMVYVEKLFLEDHAARVKKRLLQAREAATTRRRRARREELVRWLVRSVHGHILIEIGGLRTIPAFLAMVPGVIATGCLAVVLAIELSLDRKTAGIHFLEYGLAVVSLAPFYVLFRLGTQFKECETAWFVAARIQENLDAIRDVATKEEVRKLVALRMNVKDEESLEEFFAMLFSVAKKHGLGEHVEPLIIWPSRLTQERQSLSEEE